MSFSPYPRYKPSSVEWLGDVPEHWEVKRLKFCFGLITEKTTNHTNAIALENVESWSGRRIDTDSEFEGDGVAFRAGDILFGKLRPYLAKVHLAEELGEAVGDFHVLRPMASMLGTYGARFLLNRDFISIVDGSTYGAKMPRASWDFMADMPVLVPLRDEQEVIASFLDRETAKIDALVEEQKRLIELLKEKRQAIITHAVTKGLNPSVPMKPSGIEWLGDVPEHWEVLRVKLLATVISKGTTPTTVGADFTESGVRFLKAENVSDGRVVMEPEFFISEETDRLLSRSALKENDVLVVIAGATTGKSAVMRTQLLPANTNQAVCFIRCQDNMTARYLNAWLSTELVQSSVKLSSVQSAQPNLSMEDVGNLRIPWPPVEERSKVLNAIGSLCNELDGQTSVCRQVVELLSERRSALISAAVTGKIDVRDVAAQSEAA